MRFNLIHHIFILLRIIISALESDKWPSRNRPNRRARRPHHRVILARGALVWRAAAHFLGLGYQAQSAGSLSALTKVRSWEKTVLAERHQRMKTILLSIRLSLCLVEKQKFVILKVEGHLAGLSAGWLTS